MRNDIGHHSESNNSCCIKHGFVLSFLLTESIHISNAQISSAAGQKANSFLASLPPFEFDIRFGATEAAFLLRLQVPSIAIHQATLDWSALCGDMVRESKLEVSPVQQVWFSWLYLQFSIIFWHQKTFLTLISSLWNAFVSGAYILDATFASFLDLLFEPAGSNVIAIHSKLAYHLRFFLTLSCPEHLRLQHRNRLFFSLRFSAICRDDDTLSRSRSRTQPHQRPAQHILSVAPVRTAEQTPAMNAILFIKLFQLARVSILQTDEKTLLVVLECHVDAQRRGRRRRRRRSSKGRV